MLTPLDDSPWHQLLTTLDHVGTSGVRFFDRLRFAASDRQDNGVFQFTIGVHQNMNVVDGGVVAIVDGRQHNLRVSRQLRPTYDVPCGPLSIEVIEPLRRIRLAIAQNDGSLESEVIWTATMDAHEERRRFNRSWGRMLENYSRYDQIGELSGSLRRSRAGDPNRKRCAPDGRDRRSLDRCGRCRDPNQFEAAFVDDCRPRRTTAAATASFIVTDVHGEVHHFVVERRGPAVAMHGLGYGGYDDGKGPGVYCGIAHGEGEV